MNRLKQNTRWRLVAKLEIVELPKTIGFFPRDNRMMSQNFKLIRQSIQDLLCGNEKSKMVPGSHLGYRRSSNNNRLLPLGPMYMSSKFQVDPSKAFKTYRAETKRRKKKRKQNKFCQKHKAFRLRSRNA